MPENVLLLSIRPEYAEKIFDGTKRVELRRVRPRLQNGDLVILYVSSPVKAVCGAFKVDYVVAGPPGDLWEKVRSRAGITREEFDAYFVGASKAVAIFFSEVFTLSQVITLDALRETLPDFQAPQGYQYVEEGDHLNHLLPTVAGLPELI